MYYSFNWALYGMGFMDYGFIPFKKLTLQKFLICLICNCFQRTELYEPLNVTWLHFINTFVH